MPQKQGTRYTPVIIRNDTVFDPMSSVYDAKKLGEYIRARREAMGLSCTNLADRLDMKVDTISAIERARTLAPRLATLKKIADALNFSLAELRRFARAEADPPPGAWPMRLHICATVPLAVHLAARRFMHLLARHQGQNVILPTNRTAAAVFRAIRPEWLAPSLLTHHYFTDTETLGTAPDHRVSRYHTVTSGFIEPLAKAGFGVPESQRHFFEGIFPNEGSPFAPINAELKQRPVLTLSSISPAGEVYGYSSNQYDCSITSDGCRLLYLSEADQFYIDADLPSRAIFSVGFGNALQSFEIILPVIHPAKQTILKTLLQSAPSPACPASLLRRHANVFLVTATTCLAEYPEAIKIDTLAAADAAAEYDR